MSGTGGDDESRPAGRTVLRRGLVVLGVLLLGAVGVLLLVPGTGLDVPLTGGDQGDDVRELSEDAAAGDEVEPVEALQAVHGYFNAVLWGSADHDQDELEDLVEPIARSLDAQGDEDEERAAAVIDRAVELAERGDLRDAHDRVEELEYTLQGRVPPRDSHPEE
jgi:hypothetical protein